MKSQLPRGTIRSSLSVAIGAALAAGLSSAPPALGQDATDQRFGTVSPISRRRATTRRSGGSIGACVTSTRSGIVSRRRYSERRMC